MTETITVTPARVIGADGDPTGDGEPVTLTPLEIAPGNLLVRYGVGGEFTDVEFTVYLPLRVRSEENTWVDTETLIATGDDVVVRGRRCVAMVQVWRSQRGGGRGGLAVLCRSKLGKAA